MTMLQVILLAVLQGLTEFLPISSSGHLVLLPLFAHWPDQGMAFDVAVHFGTLLAVLAYFRDDVTRIVGAGVSALGGGGMSSDARLGWHLLVATLPVLVAGFALREFIDGNLRSAGVIAVTTALFGVVLWLADRFGRRTRSMDSANVVDALVIGFAQTLALVPGTSRSGITMTAALARGFDREGAARFSFLLAIPVIFIAATFLTWRAVTMAAPTNWVHLGVGVVVSAVAAYASIGWFMGFVARSGMWLFALYRLLLAAVIVVTFNLI